MSWIHKAKAKFREAGSAYAVDCVPVPLLQEELIIVCGSFLSMSLLVCLECGSCYYHCGFVIPTEANNIRTNQPKSLLRDLSRSCLLKPNVWWQQREQSKQRFVSCANCNNASSEPRDISSGRDDGIPWGVSIFSREQWFHFLFSLPLSPLSKKQKHHLTLLSQYYLSTKQIGFWLYDSLQPSSRSLSLSKYSIVWLMNPSTRSREWKKIM